MSGQTALLAPTDIRVANTPLVDPPYTLNRAIVCRAISALQQSQVKLTADWTPAATDPVATPLAVNPAAPSPALAAKGAAYPAAAEAISQKLAADAGGLCWSRRPRTTMRAAE